MRFLMVGGGTGGHINPAVAVAGRLKELMPDAKFLFVGARGNMEEELVPKEGFNLSLIDVSSLHRSLAPSEIVHNLKSVGNLARSARQSRRILEQFRPDAVIGTGGYVCYPVIRMASKMGIPTLVHESNALPGLTTRMLEKWVDVIMVGFPESRAHYKNPDKVAVTGTPVRGEFLKWDRDSAKRALGNTGRPLVVSLFGSLGARRMNEIAADIIKLNVDSNAFLHIHATGNGELGLAAMRRLLDDRGVKNEDAHGIDVRPYIYNMPLVMSAADIVICRAGASTLAELTLIGKPCVLIPSPNVTNDHQSRNAEVLGKRGGAVVLPEAECTAPGLFKTIRDILGSPERLAQMSAAMKSLAVPDSADLIAEKILETTEKYRRNHSAGK